MSFFDDNDPFEDIVNQFFGRSNLKKRQTKRFRDTDEEDSQFIEEKDKIYFIIDLSGYSEEEIQVKVKENSLIVSAKSLDLSEKQDYLASKHREGITIQKTIPENIKNKNINQTFKNGVLEVTFNKK